MSHFDIRFLSEATRSERDRVFGLTREVAEKCEEWLREFPIVKRPSVTAACSMVSVVALPGATIAELSTLTRWWLWIFGVDDVFDDPTADDDAVTAWTEEFEREVPASAAEKDLLRASLGSIHSDLAGYPLFAGLAGQWRSGMVDVVRGMLTERQWDSWSAPSFEEYLKTGMTTISVRPYTVTACVLAGDPAAAASFSSLDSMIDASARCFRLCNDLRSHVREREESKINAVSLLEASYRVRGLAEAEALEKARQRLGEMCLRDLSDLDAARCAAGPEIARLAWFLWAHTAFVWDMYRAGDYDALAASLRESRIC